MKRKSFKSRLYDVGYDDKHVASKPFVCIHHYSMNIIYQKVLFDLTQIKNVIVKLSNRDWCLEPNTEPHVGFFQNILHNYIIVSTCYAFA